MSASDKQRVAVIGAGISGLSCAWLLAKSCKVTLYEAEANLGGHSDTVEWQGCGIDNGFIVYNERTYPNLTALFAHLAVPTQASEMSFSLSLDQGKFEYGGGDLRGLVAQPGNLLKPSYWAMLAEVVRFFRQAKRDADREIGGSLAAYLDAGHFGAAFRQNYLYPMAAAIWSTPAMDIGNYPAEAFLRFNRNHGLLDLINRPVWRTVTGGSQAYVARIAEDLGSGILTGRKVRRVSRTAQGVAVIDQAGERSFDQVVMATHPDQALSLIADPTLAERHLLGAFNYSDNRVVMHTDAGLMPVRRAAWSSWNYLAQSANRQALPALTYWMNRLQALDQLPPVFVTLNPPRDVPADKIVREKQFRHPVFTQETLQAQKQLWSLQGEGGLWFCGAWFGSGFHEDGLQAGLAVAEAIGTVRRPWQVADESGRIYLGKAAG